MMDICDELRSHWPSQDDPELEDEDRCCLLLGMRAAAEIEQLRKIEAAAKNLVAQKGRHHTEQAYQRLAALVVPNAT